MSSERRSSAAPPTRPALEQVARAPLPGGRLRARAVSPSLTPGVADPPEAAAPIVHRHVNTERKSRAESQPPVSVVNEDPKLLHMDKHQATFVWGPLAMVIWRGECDRIATHRVEQAGMEVLRRHSAAALMGIVEPTAVPPSAEMRALSAASNDRLARLGVVGIAGVLSQKGFAGSFIRGVITGLAMLSRADYPFKAFEGHVEAGAWLSSLLAKRNQGMDAASCARVVSECRRRYETFWSERYGSSASSPNAGAPAVDQRSVSR
jgi:hypothetical protein